MAHGEAQPVQSQSGRFPERKVHGRPHHEAAERHPSSTQPWKLYRRRFPGLLQGVRYDVEGRSDGEAEENGDRREHLQLDRRLSVGTDVPGPSRRPTFRHAPPGQRNSAGKSIEPAIIPDPDKWFPGTGSRHKAGNLRWRQLHLEDWKESGNNKEKVLTR